MKRRLLNRFRTIVCIVLLSLDAPRALLAEPPATATAAFNAYCNALESRLIQQHRSPSGFLAPAGHDPQNADARLRRGELIVEQLTPPANAGLSGALLHHWRGTAFAPGATAADFTRLMEDFKSYPQHFAPQVLQAKVLTQSGNSGQASIPVLLRIRQRHVITVVMDTAYDVSFGQLDAQHGYSISQSTHISEIDSPGAPAERALGPKDEHGFLWRLNTYWSYEERDGGLYLQVEAVSLTRAVPTGLAWIVGPYVQSIPRESLEFTLRSARTALTK